MPITTTTAEATAALVFSYRLPKPGEHDPYYGFSRSYYYVLDKRLLKERGVKLLLHIRDEGKKRGVTVVLNAVMAAFMRSQVEEQVE